MGKFKLMSSCFAERIIGILEKTQRNENAFWSKTYCLLLKQLLKELDQQTDYLMQLEGRENLKENNKFNLCDNIEIMNFAIDCVYKKQEEYEGKEGEKELKEIENDLISLITKFEEFDHKYETVKSKLGE